MEDEQVATNAVTQRVLAGKSKGRVWRSSQEECGRVVRGWVFTKHFGGDSMQGKQRERWIELCELAAKEQDPVKLITLVEEINRLLDEREQQLAQQVNSRLTA